jgi:hypothetical protein
MSIYVLLGVTLVFLTGMLLARNERWKRRLVCPSTGTVEDQRVVHRFGREDHPVRVTSCSLFPNAKRVGCSQDCIKKGYLRAG